MKTVLLSILLAALPGVAAAAPACSAWTAELQEDEGGEVMAASACALDAPDTRLQLTCGGGTVQLRYDLALGSDRNPASEETQQVTFTFADGAETVPMGYEEMDGMFAAYLPPDASLVGRLRAGRDLSVSASGGYDSHQFGLSGSSAALGTLLGSCN